MTQLEIGERARPVALITGASRGIGAETARLLARRGYGLVLAARSAAAMEALAPELEALGGACHCIPTDVRDGAALRRLADEALARFGHVDVLLHNAGVVHPGIVVADLSDEQVDAVLETNLLAPIALTRLLLPHMLARRQGFIGFVDSVGGHVAIPSASIYSTTKFGLRGFGGALRREVAAQGVRVTIISPGFIDTELTREVQRAFAGLAFRMGSATAVAEVILKAVDGNRRELVYPGYYRLATWAEAYAPWIVDAVARRYIRHILPRFARFGAVEAPDRDSPPGSPAP